MTLKHTGYTCESPKDIVSAELELLLHEFKEVPLKVRDERTGRRFLSDRPHQAVNALGPALLRAGPGPAPLCEFHFQPSTCNCIVLEKPYTLSEQQSSCL